MKPRRPATDPATRATAPHAHPVPTRAEHAVSEATNASGDDGTTQSADWLAERIQQAKPEPGVPITNEKRDSSARGDTRESRRGSY